MLFQTEKLFQKDERQIFLRRIFRRVFLDDWLIKAIALLITFALWLGVTGMRAPTTTRLHNVALNLRVSNDKEITNLPVQEVDLVITGDKRKIDLINTRDLVVSLDLTDVSAGEKTVQILPENVNIELPQGVKLEEIQPGKIAVKLEKVAEREVAVKPETEGAVGEGFEIYDEAAAPKKVRVRGPESFVESLDFVSTEKINLENRTESFSVRQVPVSVANPKVTVLDTVVDINFNIGEKRIERVFMLPVEFEKERKTATVVLYGARSLIESLKTEDLRVEAAKNDDGEMMQNVVLPPEIQEQVQIRKIKIN